MKTAKRFFGRLRSQKGETLVEALVSILVFTLSSMLLLTMVEAASRMNQSAKEADLRRQEQLTAAETGSAGVEEASVLIGDTPTRTLKFFTHDETYSVYLAQKEDGALYSYFRADPNEAD